MAGNARRFPTVRRIAEESIRVPSLPGLLVPCLLILVTVFASRLLVPALAAFLAACPSSDPPDPDGPDPDGPDGGGRGLTLRFRSEQVLPTTDEPTVEEAELALRSVRVIGDAAPGDSSTTRERVRLEFRGDDTPDALRFDQAPPGKYAKIDVVLRGWDGDGGGDDGGSFEITGRARVNGTLYEYEIHDDAQLSASIPLPEATMLPPGGELGLEVRVDLREVVRTLAFSSITPREGKLRIDESTPAVLQAARAALMAAMSGRRLDGGREGDGER